MTAVLDPVATDPTPPRPRRRGKGWLVAGLVVAALLIADAGWNIISLLSRQSVQHHRTWAGPISAVDIHVGSGSLTVVGTNRTGVVVDATGARGLSTPSDQESVQGGVLRINSGCGFSLGTNWCKLSYRLEVPRGVRVEATTGNGALHGSELTGALGLSTGDGSLAVDHPSGPLVLHAGDGSIHVTAATSGQVSARSGDGSIHLGFTRAPRLVTAHAGDGHVTIGLPASTIAYQVTTHAGDGHVSTAIRTDPTSPRTINVSTGDGSITLRYGAG